MNTNEDTALRSARVVIPRSPADVPSLPRVAESLALATGRMATVAAPAGYGKTTQVAAWATGDGRALAWLDVERIDNDAGMLVSAILAALTTVSGFDATEIPSTVGTSDGIATIVVPALGRAVAQCETPFILVLDDVHHVDAAPSIDVLDALARAVPNDSTLVLIGRAEPSTTLTRIRVHRGIVDVTTAELALDASGAAAVLEGMGVSLADVAIEELVRDTEGWPVGVRLAALGLRHPDRATAPEEGFRRYDREAATYMREEWLRGLAKDDIDLLTQVAVLDWLSGPLCDHVLERAGTAGVLSRLHSSRLVVIPLDRRDESFRMHRLLRDVLEADLKRMDPGAGRRCHARASEWFESHGDIDRALHHALGAGDVARAEQLVIDHAASFHTSSRFATVTRWFAAFPDDYLTARPSLCLMAAVAALGDSGGQGTHVTTWLRFGEHALARSPDADEETALRFDAFRALVSISSSIADGLEDAQRARRGLPPGLWHMTACMAHGVQSFAVGDEELATEMLEEAAAEAEVIGALTAAAVCHAHLAVILSARGDWARAAPLVRAARAIVRREGLEQLATQSLVTAMTSVLEAREGNPQQAHAEWLLTRHNLAYISGMAPWLNIQSRFALARTSLLLSDRVAARTLLDEVETLLQAHPDAARPKAQLAELDELVRSRPEGNPWGPSSLTTAELRVLHYLPTNLTLAEIAERLYVSRNTTKSQALSIYRKLGVTTRGQAVETAEVLGLLIVPDSGPRT